MKTFVLLAAAAVILAGTGAQGQEKLKIGIIATLSGPPAVLGQQLRNGFKLAVKNLGGKLGGREVEVIVAGRRAQARRRGEQGQGAASSATRSISSSARSSPTSSSAIMKPVTEGGAILISPNAGTSNFAGKECNPNFFVTSYQNDQVHEVLGQVRAGHRLQEGVPDGAELPGGQGRARRLQALLQGRDRRRGLRAAEPARLLGRARQDRGREARCDLRVPAGRHGRELRQAVPPGRPRRQRSRSSPPSRSTSRRCRRSRMPRSASSAARTGRPTSTIRRTRRFVAAYEKEYGAVPATYAFQAYDAALLIDSAVRKVTRATPPTRTRCAPR